MLREHRLPAVEIGAPYAELPEGPANMARLVGMLHDLQFALRPAIVGDTDVIPATQWTLMPDASQGSAYLHTR